MKSKFSIEDKKKYKLSEEAALEVVKDFCVKFDIDIDAIDDKRQKKQMENLLSSLADFVRRGFVEINQDYSIVQHLQAAPGEVVTINYKRITGEQKLAMDGKDENEQYAKLYACLGAASGLGEAAIKKLSGIDLKIAEALSLAFL